MSNSEYTSKQIQVLDEIEHIKLNAGMYVGDTTNPTHLIEEALDNALDECLAGHADIVAVNINSTEKMYCVMDNGRGIPLDNDVPKTISTKLFSGAKFQNNKSSYTVCSGLHGVGLVAVNALSDLYIVEIYRDNRHAKYTFKHAKLVEKIDEKYDITKNPKPPFHTKIQFKPSKKIFQTLEVDVNRIRSRLLVASVELPKCHLILNNDNKREIIQITKEEFFKGHCLTENDTEISPIVDLNATDGIEGFHVKYSYSMNGSITPRIVTSVNLLPVESGGTHVSYFFDVLKDYITGKAKKLGFKFQPNDVLSGLRVYFSLELTKPEFAGQTKDKIINRREYLDKLIKKIKLEIESYYESHPQELEFLLNFFQDYRAKLDSKKLKHSGLGKRASTKYTKLRDCISENGELYIVEGDSAGGSYIQCRDPRRHAIFPLKGKIPSIVRAKDILKHNEIGELIQALGTGVGPHFNIDNLRYDKIICSTDADEDGKHIFCLLTLTLANLVPEVIQKGHYYLALTPLYAVTKGKSFIPLWSDEELKKAREKNEPITRYKGLGELSPWKLKICAID